MRQWQAYLGLRSTRKRLHINQHTPEQGKRSQASGLIEEQHAAIKRRNPTSLEIAQRRHVLKSIDQPSHHKRRLQVLKCFWVCRDLGRHGLNMHPLVKLGSPNQILNKLSNHIQPSCNLKR